MAESLWDWFDTATTSGSEKERLLGGGVPHQLIDDCPGDSPCNTNCGGC